MVDLDCLTIRSNLHRTFWPERTNNSKPLIQHRSKSPRARILDRSQLTGETVFSKQWDGFLSFRYKAAIAQPHEEIQNGRRTGENLDCFEIGRDRMSEDFLIELFTQNNDVLKVLGRSPAVSAAVIPGLRFASRRKANRAI